MQFANVLKSFITTHGLSTEIAGNQYCNVDGWKFAGLNFGLTAIPSQPIAKHKPGEYVCIMYAQKTFAGKNGKYTKEVPVFIGFVHDKEVIDHVRSREQISRELIRPYIAYECDCAIVKITDQGIKLSRGTGFCSNMEELKAGFEEYAVMSMCETRSIGKGYRNLIGFVVKAAGFEPTPAEEMKAAEKEQEFKEAEYDLPILTDGEFEKVYDKVVNNGWTVDKNIKGAYHLGPDQEKALRAAEQMATK